jgi:hypothetical protein
MSFCNDGKNMKSMFPTMGFLVCKILGIVGFQIEIEIIFFS